jgi:hypothetical protein
MTPSLVGTVATVPIPVHPDLAPRPRLDGRQRQRDVPAAARLTRPASHGSNAAAYPVRLVVPMPQPEPLAS